MVGRTPPSQSFAVGRPPLESDSTCSAAKHRRVSHLQLAGPPWILTPQYGVPGRFDPAVTVIMLGMSGASRHLGFASESLLRSSRFLLDPNILSG